MEANDTILTFDTLYTTNEIKILKLALPLLSPQIRPYVALLIKGKELKYCMEQLPRANFESEAFELSYLDSFIDNALPYCTQRQKDVFLQIKQLKQSMDMFEKMKSMMSMFDEDGISDLFTFSQNFGTQTGSPSDFLHSAMTNEQAQMYEQFKKKFDETLF